MIETATTEELERLLALFPAKALRGEWIHIESAKKDLCREVAQSVDMDAILDFVDRNFFLCKQHVYVYDAPELDSLPETIAGGGSKELYDQAEALYLTRLTYHVILLDPVQEAEISFLWPVYLQLAASGHLVVRFITLEKNLQMYLRRQYSLRSRSIKEEDILAGLASNHGLEISDLQAGVKALWDANFFDAFRVRFKKPHSTTTEEMDEEMGIREFNQSLYRMTRNAELFRTHFKVLPRDGVEPCVAHCNCRTIQRPSSFHELLRSWP